MNIQEKNRLLYTHQESVGITEEYGLTILHHSDGRVKIQLSDWCWTNWFKPDNPMITEVHSLLVLHHSDGNIQIRLKSGEWTGKIEGDVTVIQVSDTSITVENKYGAQSTFQYGKWSEFRYK